MWRRNDVPRRRRATRLLQSQLFIHFLRLGESFTREQKGGSIKILIRLARLPFLDGRVTLHAGSAFLHINSFFCSRSQNSSRSRRDNQRTRERGCQCMYQAKGSKLFSHINASLKFAGRVILPHGTALLHIDRAFIKLHLIRHSQIVWQGCKGKIERDSIAAQEREGRARKEAREHMRSRYFFPRSFLLRLDPELDRGLGNTSKTKTYSLDLLG